MTLPGQDPELMQEFLTEAGELIEQLDADLLRLESEPESKELLDGIFRALHTIKGAAGFLNLPNVTAFAHVAEDALNKLRKGEVEVNELVADALLRSVDVLRDQMAAVSDGEQPPAGPQDLMDRLAAIARNEVGPGAATIAQTIGESEAATTSSPCAAVPLAGQAEPLELTSEKQDVLPFMVDDLRATSDEWLDAIEAFTQADTRGDAMTRFTAVAQSLRSTGEYFVLKLLTAIASRIENLVQQGAELDANVVDELVPRLQVAQQLVSHFADGLAANLIYSWPLDRLFERIDELIQGKMPPEDAQVAPEGGSMEAVLLADGIADASALAAPRSAAKPSAQATPSSSDARIDQASSGEPKERDRSATNAETTIRVEVGRLETLLNLVGEMVLTKNQVLGMARRLADMSVPHDFLENAGTVAGDLDRLTAELQVGVMRTRMQPLSKLFGRYPRLIRDLAKKTGKKVELTITGGETEVDRSVLEQLGDPLVHMLRNSCDHGVEMPEQRAAAGKSELATIHLSAQHQGGHVSITIEDDGKGIDRKVIADKAIEKGLTTPELVAAMADEDVFRFIFAAGFSTAAQVSDLSGRGVGMDVVRTNIAALGGSVRVQSVLGQGTRIEVLIPLTVAIMPAMMVGVGAHDYAIPLSSVEEIVKHTDAESHYVGGRPVMRLRERVLPLIDLRERLDAQDEPGEGSFAVVVCAGQEQAGFVVDRLVGQQEVVIKPLDDTFTTGGPFSGATIREDGNVSLIMDVVKLLRAGDAARELARK
ncbi:MAG: chemotaxis protein CheA [Phycisphaerales bacterium]|nr:chemotaxis protein CheA [Phycisphaerales bacterium]